jgi:hypothetical protein
MDLMNYFSLMLLLSMIGPELRLLSANPHLMEIRHKQHLTLLADRSIIKDNIEVYIVEK